MLKMYKNINDIEVGLDECARGVMFGRLYAAAVIMPKDKLKDKLFENIKDSKKLSKKKREELYNYIIKNCIEYSISWIDEKEIDKINILQANLKAFHLCLDKLKTNFTHILVDGIHFNSYNCFTHECIKGGDNKYISIAAASILAKVSHDKYIMNLCENVSELKKYDLENNMGYGTKKHLEAINKYGSSSYHRKTFGICKNK